MLEYDRIDLSEGIDTTQNKLVSRDCSFCHFFYFLDKHFSYQKHLCNGCHDMSMKAISFNNLVVIYCRDNAYRVNFTFMSSYDAYNLMKGAIIIDKKGVL